MINRFFFVPEIVNAIQWEFQLLVVCTKCIIWLLAYQGSN